MLWVLRAQKPPSRAQDAGGGFNPKHIRLLSVGLQTAQRLPMTSYDNDKKPLIFQGTLSLWAYSFIGFQLSVKSPLEQMAIYSLSPNIFKSVQADKGIITGVKGLQN